MLVIGSESMTGTINVGDAVIYERYDGQRIKEQQIIFPEYCRNKSLDDFVSVKVEENFQIV